MARGTRTGSGFDYSLLGICMVASIVTLVLPPSTRGRSAAALRRTVAAPFVELQRRAELSRAAFLSYNVRVERMGEASQLQNEVRSLDTENQRLRAMLGLGSRLKWGFVIGEASPAGLESDLVAHQILQSFNITEGSRAGVQPFTPVVNDRGLVGMVELVDGSTSQAISYLHPDFRVSATTPNDSAVGIVQAYLGGGADRGLLEMRGVPFRSPLKAGQLIVSSGLGGTYPRGIPVGTVIRENPTAEKWARAYLLQPAAPLASLGPVFLLSKKRADEGVDGVWHTMTAADSAARAVAAAGDSLVAREAALREAAARRAAIDSAQRAATLDSTGALPPATPPATPTVPAATPTPNPTAPAATTTPRPSPATTPARPNPATTRDTTKPIRPTVPAPTTVPRPTVPRP